MHSARRSAPCARRPTACKGSPLRTNSARPLSPAWENGWFESLDAASLVGLLCQWKPRRYVEIGSGNSTIFARHAITSAGLSTTLTSIDPQPRAGIDALCDAIHRTPLEAADLALATGLEPGDVLFFDGSHRAFQNSDVVVFFLEVLPRLKPGILVHIHDMFLPDDYPPKWARRLYSEQYMLAAMMVHGQAPFEIVLPVHYVSTRPQFAAAVEAVFQGADGRTMPGARPRGATEILGSSFWLKTI